MVTVTHEIVPLIDIDAVPLVSNHLDDDIHTFHEIRGRVPLAQEQATWEGGEVQTTSLVSHHLDDDIHRCHEIIGGGGDRSPCLEAGHVGRRGSPLTQWGRKEGKYGPQVF